MWNILYYYIDDWDCPDNPGMPGKPKVYRKIRM